MKQQLLTLILAIMILIPLAGMQAQSNQYLHFDRMDDYVRLDGGSQYIANKSAFSMAGWFYTDQLAYGQGMIGFRGASHGFYLIQLSDGELECRLITDAGFHEVPKQKFTILPGAWQHVAFVYNGTHAILYIDGIAKDSVAASGQIPDANIPFTIGRSILANLNFYFGGRADEVTVWDKALTLADIRGMIVAEPTGMEPNLQLYYKFNQGQPGGNNTSISKLISEVGGGVRDADILNFTLDGNASNFLGTLQAGFQAISFSDIPNKLVTDAPFELDATASSMLPVSYQVVSGPATVNGDSVTLTGSPGTVTIRASQAGDGTWNPATDVLKSFEVVDPMVTVPTIDIRNPLPGLMSVPTLSKIHLATIVDTDFPELLSVKNVEFEINGDVIPAFNWGNKHYTAWWEPPAHGIYTVTVRATNNYGAIASGSHPLNIVPNTVNTTATAFADVLLNTSIASHTETAELPSFLGAYDKVTATLEVKCPPGGCDPWDRVAHVKLKTHEGNWIEIIRYITPYGVECSHSIDVTDFISALQGKIDFEVSYGTFDKGLEYTLDLDYQAGTPPYLYSTITPTWHKTYDFGNFANMMPVETRTVKFPNNASAAKLKLVSSGHGWGDNNTSNAAEFFETTHHIWVDNVQTFSQYNWLVCNPNPDNCSPQNGTWFHNRAGFCPGAISPFHHFDLTPYIANGSIDLDYIFDQTYVDLCNANHPNCVTGVTCPNCNDGFNPHLIVASTVISFSNSIFTGIEKLAEENQFKVFPNPSSGIVELELKKSLQGANVKVVNMLGVAVSRFDRVDFRDKTFSMDLSHLPSGMYLIMLETKEGIATKKLYLEK